LQVDLLYPVAHTAMAWYVPFNTLQVISGQRYGSDDPTNSFTASHGSISLKRTVNKVRTICVSVCVQYSTVKTEDTEALRKQKAKTGKIKARSSQAMCKNCLCHWHHYNGTQ